jgi:hypothetical protein
MQTFLPYQDFYRSAECLDNRRLGKQRVECIQILEALKLSSTSRWRNHPAVKMWKNHEISLMNYGIVICNEWIRRNFVDNCRGRIMAFSLEFSFTLPPKWLGMLNFHASHRSNLLRKDPIHYGKFGWAEPNNLPYWWPTKNGF